MTTESIWKEIQERWAKLDRNKRKLAVFVPCFLVVFTIATHPALFHSSRQVAGRMEMVAQDRAVMRTPPTGTAAASSAIASPGDFAGKWTGHGNVNKESGICSMQLEIRQESAEKFLAYPALSCMPLPSYFLTGKMEQNPASYLDMLQKSSPSTAILSGGWKDSSLLFHVEKLTTDTPCPMTSFTATPFGASELTGQWTTDKCGNGSLLLTKTPGVR